MRVQPEPVQPQVVLYAAQFSEKSVKVNKQNPVLLFERFSIKCSRSDKASTNHLHF